MQNSRIIRFGGKIVKIHYANLKPWVTRELKRFLNVYPNIAQTAKLDLIINFRHGPSENSLDPPISMNPSSHKEFVNGFAASFPLWGEVVWKIEDAIKVDMYLTRFISSRNIFFKLFDREFNYPYQYIGAILHELILTPTVLLFYGNVLPIHGSCIINRNRDVFVFSGTGGVGKTFLEMSFILKEDYGFFADDIVLIGEDSCAFANYAFPKIYKYNVGQLETLDKFISESCGTFNRIQWRLYPRLPFIGRYYRRLLNPIQMSKIEMADTGTLKKFYFLFRTQNVQQINKERISYTTALETSYDLIKTEYYRIFKHLGYHEVNRSLLGIPKIVKENELKEKYIRIFDTLQNVDFVLINIPMKYEIGDLYRFIREDIQ